MLGNHGATQTCLLLCLHDCDTVTSSKLHMDSSLGGLGAQARNTGLTHSLSDSKVSLWNHLLSQYSASHPVTSQLEGEDVILWAEICLMELGSLLCICSQNFPLTIASCLHGARYGCSAKNAVVGIRECSTPRQDVYDVQLQTVCLSMVWFQRIHQVGTAVVEGGMRRWGGSRHIKLLCNTKTQQ